jgi:ABC-type bacteriocin/lantibiotic exporter with double-glycine peptidase domain
MKGFEVKIQEAENLCLCSVLQAILKKYDIHFSQKEIARNLTPEKNGFKADDENIKQFMRKIGFDYSFYWNNTTPFNEPDTLIGEIIQNEGFIGLNSHAFLPVDINYDNIKVIDPADCAVREFNYYKILREMSKKNDGLFGLLKYIH